MKTVDFLRQQKWIHIRGIRADHADYYDKYNYRLLDDVSDTGHWILMDKNKPRNEKFILKEFNYFMISEIKDKDLIGYLTILEREIKLDQII
jgi:hypothetical protein